MMNIIKTLAKLCVLAVALVLSATSAGAQSESEAMAPPAGGPREDEYRIGPGDVLSVDVFGMPELTRKVRILRDGKILLPLVGAFPIGGLTLEEAETEIAKLLEERRLVRVPQVSLFVEEYVSRGVTIHGAVKDPGVYQMLGSRTLLEMLGEAGGISGSDVNGGLISVWATDEDGKQTRTQIDLDRLINQADMSLNMRLRPGNIVMVPFDRLSRVYVSGAVQDPGAVEFSDGEGITVLQAITAAGGPNERTKLSKVSVLRPNPDGSQEKIKVDVKKIQRGKAPDLPLRNNDVVVVGEWFF